MAIYLKSSDELAAMREAGKVTARALAEMRAAIKPGVSTWELDQIAVKVFEQHGARAAFLGYPAGSPHPFPATITASINEELVHGIPSKDRILHEGDIISIDTACHLNGFVGDAAFTAGVGQISPEAQHLLEVTEQSLYVGINASRAGSFTSDVSRAIQGFVEGQGYGVVQEYTGHGVGRAMHEDPSVPNWWPDKKTRRRMRRPWRAAPLKNGMTYALEPMVSIGDPATRELADHWTVVTPGLSAHFEHTIAVMDDEPIILTLLPDGSQF
jgi:methionyl aminopeptidase